MRSIRFGDVSTNDSRFFCFPQRTQSRHIFANCARLVYRTIRPSIELIRGEALPVWLAFFQLR